MFGRSPLIRLLLACLTSVTWCVPVLGAGAACCGGDTNDVMRVERACCSSSVPSGCASEVVAELEGCCESECKQCDCCSDNDEAPAVPAKEVRVVVVPSFSEPFCELLSNVLEVHSTPYASSAYRSHNARQATLAVWLK